MRSTNRRKSCKPNGEKLPAELKNGLSTSCNERATCHGSDVSYGRSRGERAEVTCRACWSVTWCACSRRRRSSVGYSESLAWSRRPWQGTWSVGVGKPWFVRQWVECWYEEGRGLCVVVLMWSAGRVFR